MERLVEVSLPGGLDTLHSIDSRVVAATPNLLATGTPDEFFDFLNEGGEPITFTLTDEEGQHVGLLALVDLDDTSSLEVRDILVMPGRQRSGLGQRMMAKAEEIAVQLSKDRIILVTSPDNAQALHFYNKLGYVIDKEIENYYGDGTPRYVLAKYLPA